VLDLLEAHGRTASFHISVAATPHKVRENGCRLEGILYEVAFREVPIPHEFQPEQGQLGGQATQRTVDIYHQGQGNLVRLILGHGEVQLEVQ